MLSLEHVGNGTILKHGECIIASTYVLPVDPDRWHRPLPSEIGELGLDQTPILCSKFREVQGNNCTAYYICTESFAAGFTSLVELDYSG